MEYDTFSCRLDRGDNPVHGIEVSRDFFRTLSKLSRKDKKTLEATLGKMEEISCRPEHYKPLCGPLKGYRRAHIGSLVALYSVNTAEKKIAFEKLAHHDSVY